MVNKQRPSHIIHSLLAQPHKERATAKIQAETKISLMPISNPSRILREKYKQFTQGF